MLDHLIFASLALIIQPSLSTTAQLHILLSHQLFLFQPMLISQDAVQDLSTLISCLSFFDTFCTIHSLI